MRTPLSLPTLLLATITAAAGLHLLTQERSLHAAPSLSLPTYTSTTPQQKPAEPTPMDSGDGRLHQAPEDGRPVVDVITHEDREPLRVPPLKIAVDEPIIGC